MLMETAKSKGRTSPRALDFEQLLEEYYDKLQKWGVVLSRGDRAMAQEIVHELCLHFISQINIALRREIPFNDRFGVQLRAEAYNLFNHPDFGYVDPSLTDALFGQATLMLNQSFGPSGSLYEPGGPRSLQISLRLHF